MAAVDLLVKTVHVHGCLISVMRLRDRRAQGGSEEKEWVYQKQLETLLYSNGYAQSTGAVYRLLKRCPAGTPPSLPLKKASIAEGLVTASEWAWIYQHLQDVRSITLISLTTLEAALGVFGQSAPSEGLVVEIRDRQNLAGRR